MPWDFWLILVVLVFVIPWRGHQRLKKLFAKPQVESAERLGLYASTIAFQWFATVIVGWRAWARGVTSGQLGLSWQGGINVFGVSIAGVVIFGLLHWLNLRRVGKLPGAERGLAQNLAERILPRSRSEFVVYVVLALTAGICEEFLYRGFVMAILSRAGFALWSMVLISSIFFGLAHIYQGRSGFVSTLLVGVVFGLARIAYHSLEPVILWHAAIDIVAGFAGYRYLLRNVN
jgi:membrane protease YdiL (CAAX protease family)